MNSFDDNEKNKKIIRYVKYIIPLIIVLVLILILFKGTNYSALEEKLIEATKKYVNENNINTSGEKYIEATKVELIEGMELCSKNSGVLITNNIYKAYLKCPDYQSKILDIDGVRVTFDDGWALVRASNTGPNLTVRCEAETKKDLENLRKNIENIIEHFKQNP